MTVTDLDWTVQVCIRCIRWLSPTFWVCWTTGSSGEGLGLRCNRKVSWVMQYFKINSSVLKLKHTHWHCRGSVSLVWVWFTFNSKVTNWEATTTLNWCVWNHMVAISRLTVAAGMFARPQTDSTIQKNKTVSLNLTWHGSKLKLEAGMFFLRRSRASSQSFFFFFFPPREQNWI